MLHWCSSMSYVLNESTPLSVLFIFLCLGHVVLKGLPAFLSNFVLQSCLPWDPTYLLLPSAALLPHCVQNLTLSYFMVTTAKAAAHFHIPNLFFHVSEDQMQLSNRSPLANPISVSWIYLWQSLETSWTAHFSSCWSSNWCPGRLNSFIRTKVNDSEASSCAPKTASSTFLRWWDTSNTHPLWCPFHRPFPWPTSSPPAHHLLHWGAPYTLFLSSPEESVQLLQECKLLPQISVIPTILQLSKNKFLFSVLLQYLRVYFIFRTASTGMESGRKNKTSFGYSKRIEEQPWLLLLTSANRQKHRYRRAKTAVDFGAQVEGSDGI